MKRNSILTLAAALLLAVSLAACGGGTAAKTDSIVGDWSAVLSVGEELSQAMAEDEELGQYFDDASFENFDVTLVASFGEDNTYSISVDEESMAAAMEQIKEPLEAVVRAYLEDMVAEMGLEMSVDEMMEASGMSIDDLLAEMDLGEMTEGFENSGTYKLDGDKLYLDDNTSYENITLDGNTLTFNGPSEDVEDEDNDLKDFYPIVFERVG